MIPWLSAVAVLIIDPLLLRSGRGMRRRRGLDEGRTLDLDSRNLYSRRYGLAGRPDKIFEGGIPEEW